MASGASKYILTGAWLLTLGFLGVLATGYTGSATQFFGIADDKEQTIRFSSPVEILRYGFVSEHEVGKGDLIVEVRQPDLDAELLIVDEQMRELKFNKEDALASMRAEVVELRANLTAEQSAIESQLRGFVSRQRAATSMLNALGDANGASRNDQLTREIASLRVRKRANREALEARIGDLQQKLSSAERPVDARIAELAQRKQELERQAETLVVRSQVDGRIGSVLFKVGETVAPFQPILTIHGSQPTFVKGYIHESVFNDIANRQVVWVRSLNPNNDTAYQGTVASLGTRIVEFPARLLVSPIARAWGREVIVSLDPEHALLLGEKVSIHLHDDGFGLESLTRLIDEVMP